MKSIKTFKFQSFAFRIGIFQTPFLYGWTLPRFSFHTQSSLHTVLNFKCPPFLIYPFFPARHNSNFQINTIAFELVPLQFPRTPFSPSTFLHRNFPSHLQVGPFFPSPLQWQFQITITLGLAPIGPLSPPIFPITISPPISNPIYPFFPQPTPTMAISNHDHLGVGPNWPLSPPIFPHRNFPSHLQMGPFFPNPPHTQNGNFQIIIARAHFQSASLFKIPLLSH
ncbi:uncharacterized protein Gasu_62690 [Galdieria sulphuraria]|uniref:Uncharacterized protein n=1 Tax=Galdieria sulphuraria TaxID=130081 RepID=M2VSG6_GALSU|nr:uncharacterized protein Gasu_62690 [Galdieria sulphuraria]EME26081.1 hypothetical protein Gasu_62690 [Galdieria sulphuraria]|eukprot:XP_005702601.1 hypothetical protein Gasu_62690 [Galdieria sulphuraria]